MIVVCYFQCNKQKRMEKIQQATTVRDTKLLDREALIKMVANTAKQNKYIATQTFNRLFYIKLRISTIILKRSK